MNKIICLIMAFMGIVVSSTSLVQAQGLGVNSSGNAPDASAILDASSTTKGALLPRMTTAQRNAITLPAEGLQIFNTTTKCFEFYSNGWQTMACACTSSPTAPVAAAGSSITTTSFTANWAVSISATAYFLDVATDNAFSSFVSGYNNLNIGVITAYNVTGLTAATTYYFRVRASNTCGTSGNSAVITTVTSFTCGSVLTDSRDGKTYTTVLIGTQCWMSQNINYGTFVNLVSGGQNGAGTQKYCMNLNGTNDNTCPMGGLYEWAEIMNGSASCNGTGSSQPACTTPVQGICPSGWHIPSHYEWTLLEKNAGSTPNAFPYDMTTNNVWLGADEGGNLKVTPVCGSLPCWNSPNTGATNSKNYSAIPGGWALGGTFGHNGLYGNYWTSTENDGTNAWLRYMGSATVQIHRGYDQKAYAFSLRCVMN